MKHLLFLFLLTSLLARPEAIRAQGLSLTNPRTFAAAHEFKNAQGDVLVQGVFLKLSNGRVQVRAMDGKEIEVPMADLAADDQEFVRFSIESNKKKANAEKVIKDTLYLLDVSRPIEIAKGCDRLRTLGKYGSPAATNVLNLARACPDAKAKNDLFLTFVEISEISEGSIATIFNSLTSSDFREVLARVERNPAPFFEAYSKMGDAAVEYLQFVAFRARLLAPDVPPVAPTEADKLEVSDKETFKLRAAAIDALASVPGHAALNAVLKTLEAAEHPALGGAVDDETVKACLRALGNLGLDEEDVQAALQRHVEAYPDLVAKAQDKLKKANSKK